MTRNAIITASYAPDFERCKILCETMDRHATGYECHYILVDAPDLDLFRELEGPKRRLIADTELLPWWFRRLPAAISPKRRRLWLSPGTVPLHGWHVQQIMRIAVARLLDVDGLLYCDSDTAFVRPFDVGEIWVDGKMRLYREDGGAATARNDHLQWAAHAAAAFGLDEKNRNDHNYVCSFVTWKRQTVLDMCAHMEKVRNRHWISVVGSTRKFSECMLYGAYVDGVLDGAGHVADPVTLCPMQWFNPAPSFREMQELVGRLEDSQVAVGVQSFIPVAAEEFREAVTGLGRAA
jgi:Family of unknown function (DUF6492)